MFFSSPPALVCAVATQDAAPLHAALLELAAKSEALALTLTEKNERVLLLARCGAIRKYAGDNAGAAARAAEAKALIPTFNTNEDGALDHAKLAIALYKAGDTRAIAYQFVNILSKNISSQPARKRRFLTPTLLVRSWLRRFTQK